MTSSSTHGDVVVIDNVPLLLKAIRECDSHGLARLISLPFTNCQWKGYYGQTLLHVAALRHFISTSVTKRLIDMVEDVNAKDHQGLTALHIAVQQNNIGMVRLMLNDPRVDLNVRDLGGHTPYWLAAAFRFTLLMRLFEECGRYRNDFDSTITGFYDREQLFANEIYDKNKDCAKRYHSGSVAVPASATTRYLFYPTF